MNAKELKEGIDSESVCDEDDWRHYEIGKVVSGMLHFRLKGLWENSNQTNQFLAELQVMSFEDFEVLYAQYLLETSEQ